MKSLAEHYKFVNQMNSNFEEQRKKIETEKGRHFHIIQHMHIYMAYAVYIDTFTQCMCINNFHVLVCANYLSSL